MVTCWVDAELPLCSDPSSKEELGRRARLEALRVPICSIYLWSDAPNPSSFQLLASAMVSQVTVGDSALHRSGFSEQDLSPGFSLFNFDEDE